MATRPRVRLRKPLERHLRAGHPWIFGAAIEGAALATGSIVDVVNASGHFVARGLYDAASPIAVRVMTRDETEDIDAALVDGRLAAALAARATAYQPAETNAFRWCNGEGDFLPGVVVNVYAHVAVVRIDGEAARTLLPWAVASLVRLGQALGITHVIERSRGDKATMLWGDTPPAVIEIREAGVRMMVDVHHGQKTGSFLDQRENRRAIRPFATDEEVANLFSYTGGFSLHAALAGARSVTSVDTAAPALETARQNFSLNGLDPRDHHFAVADAFLWLERARRQGREFGLVIVDPPSFAPSERTLARALAAYRSLMTQAIGITRPGGILALSSCSSHVTAEAFLAALGDASASAQHQVRVLEVRGQPADHPTLPAFPEGRYLKFVIAQKI